MGGAVGCVGCACSQALTASTRATVTMIHTNYALRTSSAGPSIAIFWRRSAAGIARSAADCCSVTVCKVHPDSWNFLGFQRAILHSAWLAMLTPCAQHSDVLPGTANYRVRTRHRCSGAPRRWSSGAATRGAPSARTRRQRASPLPPRQSDPARCVPPTPAALRAESAAGPPRSRGSHLRARGNTRSRSDNRVLRSRLTRWERW